MTNAGQQEKVLLDTLRQVIDPEIGCNIVDLGLVYSVNFDEGRVGVVMTLTTPGCPMHESISWGVRNALLGVEGVTDVLVDIVWDPPWHPSMMTEAGRAMTGMRNF
jgi:metal-sulfur cluster biosynthetic enzyme